MITDVSQQHCLSTPRRVSSLMREKTVVLLSDSLIVRTDHYNITFYHTVFSSHLLLSKQMKC